MITWKLYGEAAAIALFAGFQGRKILIGFTAAGFVEVLVPASPCTSIFLTEKRGLVPDWWIVLENAMVAPLVAASTFIGPMGNVTSRLRMH